MTGRLLLRLIGFYQRAVSPALPPRCRFYPTCSAYAAEAVTRHGAARGSWLALRRLVKCAPWHPGGVDLVPEARPARDAATGTGAPGHSSCSAPASHPRGDRRTDRAIPPASRRAPEESSVA